MSQIISEELLQVNEWILKKFNWQNSLGFINVRKLGTTVTNNQLLDHRAYNLAGDIKCLSENLIM